MPSGLQISKSPKSAVREAASFTSGRWSRLDSFDRFMLAGVDVCSGDVLPVLDETVNPALDGAQICVILFRDIPCEILWKRLTSSSA